MAVDINLQLNLQKEENSTEITDKIFEKILEVKNIDEKQQKLPSKPKRYLGRIKFEDFYSFTTLPLRLIGLQIDEIKAQTKAERIKKVLFKSRFYWVLINLVLFLCALLTFFFVNQMETIDSSMLILAFVHVCLVVIKFITIKTKILQIREIFSKLQKSFKIYLEDQVKFEIPKQLTKLKTQWILFVFNVMFGIVAKAIWIFGDFLFTGSKNLLTDIWLPFNVKSSVFTYLPTVFWENQLIVCVEMAHVGIDWISFAMITLVIIEFKILKSNIKEVLNDSEVTRDSIKSLIIRHNEILDICESINDVVSPILFFTFFESSFSIGLALTRIANNPDDFLSSHRIMSEGSFIIVKLSLIFMFCNYSQGMIDASEDLADVIYSARWYEIKDIKLRKMLLLMLQKSQESVQLSGLDFIDVSLETFATILDTAYSYIAIVNAFYF